MTTFAYRPQHFARSFRTPLGGALLALLVHPDAVRLMETAIRQNRPPLEPLAGRLIALFGCSVLTRRTRQMVGHMIRQIMEARGYRLARARVRLRGQGLFATAAGYR